jgi:O-antigen/teichoic acid export membrane protein
MIAVKSADSWLGSLLPAAARGHRLWPRAEQWLLKLGEFFLAQGCLQVLMAVGGFLLLRWMAVEDYAVFTLAFAIQSAMIAFVDVGFSGSIVPLVGSRTGDRAVIGAYVAGARQLRRWFLPFVLLGGLLAVWILGSRQQRGWGMIAGLFALVAVTIWFNAMSVLYGAPVVIRQELRFLQLTQNAMGGIRVLAYVLGHFTGWLGALFALGLNTAIGIGQALAVRRRSGPHFDEPGAQAPETAAARQEILRFVRPQVPLLVFNAVQGQIIVFLVSIFGSGMALAATGALSRLNLIFSVAPYFFGWIVQPYFARIDARLVRRRFWQLTLGCGGVLATVPLVGFLLPEPFLWLLGPNYDHLRWEVGLLLLAGSVGTAVGLVATLTLSRRWIVADAILWVAPFTVGLQAATLAWVDVTQPAGAISVMIAGNTGSLIAYLILAWRGQRRAEVSLP